MCLAATYHWEESERPSQRIYLRYGADDAYFDDRSLAMPFLIAGVVPALRRGEKRITVDSMGACPWLLDNLKTFMGYLINWYWYRYDRHPDDRTLPDLEVDSIELDPPRERRTASFYSGGVDSLYSLRRNRINIARGHPGSISDAIFVHGFDMGTRPQRGTEEDFFQSVIDSMQPVIEPEGLNVIPVFTNMRSLDKGTDCWVDEYMACAMSAVAHGLVGKLTDVIMASSHEIPGLHPSASHPMLDPRLSSYGCRINHDGELYSRVDRVRMISQWPEAMRTLRVCFFGDDSGLNCGKCPKCLRTKLELICAGKLDQAVTFPGGEPSPAQIRADMPIEHNTIHFMGTLERELRVVGRHDLADAVRSNRRKYHISRYMGVRELLQNLDRKIMKGALKRRITAGRQQTW